MANYPAWAVLNLCKLIYCFERGSLFIPKFRAAEWASKNLPPQWRPVIKSALRVNEGRENAKDRAILKNQAGKFFRFASVRIVAFDSTWDSGRELPAHLRKSLGTARS